MTETQINGLVFTFTQKTLPKSEWTHAAHIVVALWHNWHFEFDEAFTMVKRKIIAYNEAVGTPNTESSGYHETLTMFWMILTSNHLRIKEFQSLEEACSTFLESTDALKTIPLEYYSKELLFSKIARRKWVRSDLQQIE